jgi:hypothetical protein
MMNDYEIFEGAWNYEDDNWESAETFSKLDGAFLSAMELFEDYLAGPRTRRGARRVVP